jgi:hypothetical protein
MKLILVPSLITLGVTILRVVGELRDWSPLFFGKEAGGGGAIVGISWLPIFFGIYFALKLGEASSADLFFKVCGSCAGSGKRRAPR